MTIALDHLFICTEPQAPGLDALLSQGFLEGSANSHPGQGTANRRLFFRNLMLEFLWVTDDREVTHPAIAPTRLWERCHPSRSGYAPFGLIFRREEEAIADGARLDDIPGIPWNYRPPYLPAHLSIALAGDTPAHEPFYGVIPFGGRPDALPPERAQPLDHPCGARDLTHLTLYLPLQDEPSAWMQAIAATGFVTFVQSRSYFVEIECDRHCQGKFLDGLPHLPLRLLW